MSKKLDFLLRIVVIIVALASPFICIGTEGELNSYSQYWSTDIRPLFIFTNAATSYFLFSMDRWKFPAICLLLLTAFSHDQYFWVHNITAICFFVLCAISILSSRKFQFFIIPYFSSIIILVTSGILGAEVFAITVICIYHFVRLIEYHIIESTRKKLKNQ